jgi:hypothetical protein
MNCHLPRNVTWPLRQVVAVVVFTGMVMAVGADTVAEWRVFRAIEDRRTYEAQPDNYERLPGPAGGKDVYVEKKPALVIPAKEIRAVLVDRQPSIHDVEDAVAYLRNREESEKVRGQYVVTVYLTQRGAGSLNAFLNKHSGQLIIHRVGNQTLSMGRLVGPFSAPEMTLIMAERDPDKLKPVLAPIADKVIWK